MYARNVVYILFNCTCLNVKLTNQILLFQSANTSLNSKVVSQNSNSELSPIAVDAVIKILANPATDTNVNLKDIKIIKKLGGTVEVFIYSNHLNTEHLNTGLFCVRFSNGST